MTFGQFTELAVQKGLVSDTQLEWFLRNYYSQYKLKAGTYYFLISEYQDEYNMIADTVLDK